MSEASSTPETVKPSSVEDEQKPSLSREIRYYMEKN